VTVRFEFVTEIAPSDTQTGVSRQLTDNHTYAEGPVFARWSVYRFPSQKSELGYLPY
jgi:hypothetical protein